MGLLIRTYAAERSKPFPLLAGGLRGVWEGHPCPDTPDESGNYNIECVSPVNNFSRNRTQICVPYELTTPHRWGRSDRLGNLSPRGKRVRCEKRHVARATLSISANGCGKSGISIIPIASSRYSSRFIPFRTTDTPGDEVTKFNAR